MKIFSVQAKFEISSSAPVMVTTNAAAKATIGGTFTSVFFNLCGWAAFYL